MFFATSCVSYLHNLQKVTIKKKKALDPVKPYKYLYWVMCQTAVALLIPDNLVYFSHIFLLLTTLYATKMLLLF